ncbi:MAG: hypothetical protein ACKPKO_65260, partial [Candidatus Fonsibacter sp.]
IILASLFVDLGAEAILLTLQVLRHELLQGLRHRAALQLEQFFFGGRLPDSFPEAGVLDSDQEHFWNIMLGEAEVQSHLRDYMAVRLKLEKYANWPWTRTTTQQDTAERQVLAKDASQHVWMLHDAYKAA